MTYAYNQCTYVFENFEFIRLYLKEWCKMDFKEKIICGETFLYTS